MDHFAPVRPVEKHNNGDSPDPSTKNGEKEPEKEDLDGPEEEELLERRVAAVREDHAYLSSKEERRLRARAAAAARRAGGNSYSGRANVNG